MIAHWQAALAHALVGEALQLPEPGGPAVPELLKDLADRGWDAQAIATHAAARQSDGLPWPHPPSPGLRDGIGAAQFHAALLSAREQLGLVAPQTRPPSRRTQLTPDEVRLRREVPPHHGT